MVIKLGTFSMKSSHPTPLVFTSTGGMGCEATVFYRRLVDLLATCWGQEYSQTINWLRCRLSFALLRCAIMCIHRSRSSVPILCLGHWTYQLSFLRASSLAKLINIMAIE